MICDDYRFIRIHIKKCGGRSFSTFFPNKLDTHESMSDYEKLAPDKIQNYFKWTIVRNSWERIVSLYFYLQQEVNFFGKSHRYPNFENFVSDIYFSSRFSKSSSDLGKWPFESKPQMDYLKTFNTNLKLDYICFLPRIDSDFEILKERCGFPKNWKYPHYGKSNHHDYRTYYNDFTAELVGLLYAEEIEYFGFKFDDKNQFKF